MTIDYERMKQVADGYTAAWNSGSSQAVAEFYATDGEIAINRGEPWKRREGIAAMADRSTPTTTQGRRPEVDCVEALDRTAFRPVVGET
jgi:uncharacterized protein (TIGR02246 family)